MYRLPFSPFVFSLLASTMLSGRSVALEASGNAVSVDPAVNAAGPGGKRLLEVEGAVFMGDEIVAGPSGLAQIKFVDDTKIVVGPNSRLKIDSFVFNPDNTAKKVSVSAIKGVFRFITGRSPHEAYSIHTPTLTIGVRGSAVEIYVAASGSSNAMFSEGSGTACDAAGCIPADHCSLIAAPIGGGLGEQTGEARQSTIGAHFPFLVNGVLLDPSFQVNNECATADSRFFLPGVQEPYGRSHAQQDQKQDDHYNEP